MASRNVRAKGIRSLADEDLMALVRKGDATAFEVVFDRHSSFAFSLAYRMCGSRARAEDVTQEAFLSLWRSGGQYDPARGSVRTWILSTVRNRAIDVLRRENVRDARDVHDERLAECAPGRELTEVLAQRRDDAAQVRGALASLPAGQRQVIELAYFGGFTHVEIAEMLELPAGTVKGRMRLGLSKMRGSLDGRGLLP